MEKLIYARPPGPNITTLGKNLRKIRLEQGISQERFAEQLEVNRPQLQSWEDGRAHPQLHLLIKICRKLQIVDIASFVEDENFAIPTLR